MELQDTLDKISQLQSTEEQLYRALTQNAENVALGKSNTFSDTEVQDITSQINSLSTSRVNLYNSLSEIYKSEASNENNAKESLDQQTKTLQLLEQELNKSKKKLASLKDEKLNQLKMIEITSYYSKQYDAYRRLMRMITIIGICILVAIGLDRIPMVSVVSRPLITLICIVGGIMVLKRVVSMTSRSTDNYDEFIWPMAPTTDAELATANLTARNIIGVTGAPFICAESSCCNVGTVWSDLSGCVLDPSYKPTA
jgi:hypothetical protein